MAEQARHTIRIVITEPHPGATDALQERLTLHLEGLKASPVEIVGCARDGLEAAQMAAQLEPDIILVHEQLPGMDGYEACEMMSLAAPNVAAVLLVGPSRLGNEEVNRHALRAGARAVMATDSSAELFIETLTGLAELSEGRNRPEYELITDPMRMPVTIAVTGAKGGIGKTTIATNLAVTFAKRFPKEVLLVDFYGQYGNVPLMLNLSSNGNIADLASFAAELDINIIETHLSSHADTTLKILAGFPEGIASHLAVEDEIAFLADLVGLLRRHYRFVFFDVPPLVGRASSYILSRCQYILLISNIVDLNTIRGTATLYHQLLEMRIAPERIKLIINCISRNNEFSLEDLRQATGVPEDGIAFQLPEDAAAAVGSVNEGAPCVISRPGSALASGIRELTSLLVGEMAETVLEGRK